MVNKSTSIIESINRMILVGCSKDIDYPQSYNGRCDSQLIRYSEGEGWMEPILKKRGIPLCEGAKTWFKKSEILRDKSVKKKN